MTGQQPEDGADREPIHDRAGDGSVEQFFAAHRAQIGEEPADDVTWQRIRDGRRRERSTRRGAWTGGLVAAAAALAVVVGPSLLPGTEAPDVAAPGPSATEPPLDGPGGGLPTDQATPNGPETPNTASTPVPDGEIPQDARFIDTTTADPDMTANPDTAVDSGVRLGLVTRECGAGRCAMLVSSADSGVTWAPRADLQRLGTIERVLFADHARGWVWGPGAPLWTTTDGGATWTSIPTPDDRVLDVSVRDDILLATTAADLPCLSTPCELPPAGVVLTDPTDTDWRDDLILELEASSDVAVLGVSTERYVVHVGQGGRIQEILRLQDGLLETTAGLSTCDDGPVGVAASLQDPAHLFALCEDQRGLMLQDTGNAGRAWNPTNRTVPSFVLGERAPVMASLSADHLVLVGQGNYSVTTDGGQTWSAEAFLPGATGEPAGAEVTPFGEIIVYPTEEQSGPDLAYWSSGDGGATWDVRTPRG